MDNERYKEIRKLHTTICIYYGHASTRTSGLRPQRQATVHTGGTLPHIRKMKVLLVISILICSTNIALTQTNNIDTTFYLNDQISSIDSTYACDSIRLHKNFYADIDSIDNGAFYLGEGDWTQIESEGEYLRIGAVSWTQHGKWTYWDKKGVIRRETFSPNDGLGTRYVNQWLPNGSQCLVDGFGQYYQRGAERHTEFGIDSTIYEIRDSLKNGSYTVWCPNEHGSFFMCASGQYIDNKEQPVQLSFFENG